MEEKFKSGFISLVGRTNVGKSTLLNALTGEKVAIATCKPQTTRTAIKAIINGEDYQMIITDTPGIHKPRTKLSETMIDTAFKMLTEVDCIMFLIEATSKEIKLIELYRKEYNFSAIVPISAEKNQGIDMLISEILKLLPEGPKYYADDEYTDQTARQLAEEIIREKALKLLNDEVPHGIYVEIEKFAYRKTSKQEDIYDIDATIYCVRESHKGIIIGKGGNLLKRIATYARQDIEEMLGTKVNLKVWVKVKPDWQENDSIVNKFKLK